MAKVSIILTSGSREKLQFAAMLASVAAVSAYEVTIFVSMNALPHFIDGKTVNAPNEGKMGKLIETKNAPPFLELFKQAVELGGAKIYPCSMAVDILGSEGGKLHSFVAEPMGLTKFVGLAEDGQCWSF